MTNKVNEKEAAKNSITINDETRATQKRVYSPLDALEDVSEDSAKTQELLRLAWVGCMNLADNCHYRFDPDKSDEHRNHIELYGVMTVLEECVAKLQSLDDKVEHAAATLIKDGQ